jgi:ABC-type phosphate transport system substrate-binding protein
MTGLHRQRCAITAMAVLILAGCATSGTGSTRGDPDLLTREQILSVQGATTLYDVVERLRPRWLQVRAEYRSLGSSTTEIAVFQDQTYLGNVDYLRQLAPDMAYQLKWVNGEEAQDKLSGANNSIHLAGAIIMSTRSSGGGGE